MPSYRGIQKYKELGFWISDSALNDRYAAACEKLKPLYNILVREVLSKAYINRLYHIENEAKEVGIVA